LIEVQNRVVNNHVVKPSRERDERALRSKQDIPSKQKSGIKSSETRKNSETTLRGWLNDSIKLHPLHGRQWGLGAVDMRLHDAERLAKPELQVLKLNSNDDIILDV